MCCLRALFTSRLFLSMGKYNPYKYQFNPNKSFLDYNIEQQGDIARDIFLKNSQYYFKNQLSR